MLTVTVIPLDARLNPLEMTIEFNPHDDKNLKNVFANPSYWRPIFENHSPLSPPQFR